MWSGEGQKGSWTRDRGRKASFWRNESGEREKNSFSFSLDEKKRNKGRETEGDISNMMDNQTIGTLLEL